MNTILWVLLVMFLLGVLPLWPYSMNWGYYPVGGMTVFLIIALVFTFNNRSLKR